MANGDHPSYLTSTTSQIVLITVACYAISALTLVVIGAWKGNAQFIQIAQTSMESLFTVVFPLYAVRKGLEAGKHGASQPGGTP